MQNLVNYLELNTEIPPLFSLFFKMPEACLFFRLSFNFQCQRAKKLRFIPTKAWFSLLSSEQWGAIVTPPSTVLQGLHEQQEKCKFLKILKNVNFRDIQNA